MSTYQIVRKFFKRHPDQLIASGLDREAAEAHCQDPETSSSTCTEPQHQQRTQKFGPWFDCFYAE